MNRKTAFLLAVLAQFALLGWMVAAQERVLAHGRRIELKIEPFDPIDPLSGRYLQIRVAVSRVDLKTIRPAWDTASLEAEAASLVGQEVVVTLGDTNGDLAPEDVVNPAYFEPSPSTIALRGQVKRHFGSTIDVEYGLERFFIPADASDPSPLMWQQDHRLEIVVRAMPDGRSTLEDLLIDGEPFALWNARQPE